VINHARTLLLNVAGATSSREDTGEEYIPATYAPVRETSYTLAVRRTLLGAAPDRFFLNFRARELMHQLHATELAEYVYALDPRVTYWPETSAPFFATGSKISIQPVAVPETSKLLVTGRPTADNGLGRSLREYEVTADADTVTVATVPRRGEMRGEETASFDPLSGASVAVRVPRSPLSVRVVRPESGSRWRFTTLAQPEPAVTTLIPILEMLGEPVFLELFGLGNSTEPYRTFKNLWFDHPDPVYRLGGLTLALIYRTHDIRSGVNV
jgi:hypothetical protein